MNKGINIFKIFSKKVCLVATSNFGKKQKRSISKWGWPFVIYITTELVPHYKHDPTIGSITRKLHFLIVSRIKQLAEVPLMMVSMYDSYAR